MTIQFVPATRSAAKARIALAGPSGSGKTYTGLALACKLADKVAVIDTERGSASKYVGLNGWSFDTLVPTSFSPQSLSEALAVAGGQGYGCVVVDSLSHYWMGADGMLEQVDRRAKGGNNFSGWKEARPDERRMIDALVSYPGHVVVTLRVKTEYVIEKDDRGKSVPKKVGLRPEQREGIEYEFDVIGDLDLDNTLAVSKTRIPMLHGAVIPQPGPEFAETIRDWLADGEEVAGPLAYRAQALDSAADRDTLLALLATVRSAGMVNAPVTDQDGNPTTLEGLVLARGRALASAPPASDAPPAESEKRADPPKQAAQKSTRSGGKASSEDTAKAARVVVDNRAKAMGIEETVLYDAYRRHTGRAIAEETDPAPIRQFIADLDGGKVEVGEAAGAKP